MVDFVERRIQSSGNTTNANIDRNQPYVDTIVNGKKARVYGSQDQLNEYQERYTPDGKVRSNSALQNPSESTKVNQGEATVITGFDLQGAIQDFRNGEPAEQVTDPNKTQPTSNEKLPNRLLNPLEQFASYTPLWTMACLNKAQFNQPDLYRNNPASLQNIIFSSAGRFDSQRVETFYGRPEYFVQKFEMKSIITATPQTGNSNAVLFELEIYEPYSMGLLLQSMQNAAINSGYANYLDNAPYVFRLDMQGYSEDGTPFTAIKPKFFVVKITNTTFDVNEGGSTYKLTAIPYNHSAYSNTINSIFKDIAISPGKKGTVKELLVEGPESLTSVLNNNESRLVEEGQIGKPDVYVVEFPTSSDQFVSSVVASGSNTATQLINRYNAQPISSVGSDIKLEFGDNPIGASVFGFDESNGGNFKFSRATDVIDEETGRIIRDKMQIDFKQRTFHFKQNQSLTEIIVQCILSSKYAADALKPSNIDDEGFISWFRIDAQVQFLDYDDKIGDYSRLITYRVVPFKVHHSIFTNPTSPPIGYDKLAKKIVKAYNYIYTGENTDVLKFDISIKNQFFNAISGSSPGNTGDEDEKNQGGIAIDGNSPTPVKRGTGDAEKVQKGKLFGGRIRTAAQYQESSNAEGISTYEKEIAVMFNNAFINNIVDLVNLNLEIMGDPYWMVDSGLNNYFSPPSDETELKNEDGTANYEGSDIYIYITFRTPQDVNTATSLYNFSNEEVISPFSGIYKVISCVNIFDDGTFKQTLKCIRMRGQAIDFDESLDKNKNDAGVFDQEPASEPTNQHVAPDAKSFNVEVDDLLNSAASTEIRTQPNERPNQPPPPPDGIGQNIQVEIFTDINEDGIPD